MKLSYFAEAFREKGAIGYERHKPMNRIIN